MKNVTTGLFELKRYIKTTGYTVTATGATEDEAKAALKAAVITHKTKPLVPSGKTIRSPGCVMKRDSNGHLYYEMDHNRQVPIMIHPDVLALQKAGEGNENE